MSASRRWDQRRFHLEESTTQNNGARTIFIEHMTPGTTVPPHYHSQFSETFDLISGSMKVYQVLSVDDSSKSPDSLAALEASAQELKVGTTVTVQPGVYHKYLVGEDATVLRAVVEPGYADFERLLMILNGLAEDGRLEALGDSVVLMAMIMGLSDAHLIGEAGEMLKKVREEKSEEIEELRRELLEKYDNEEQLKKLLDRGD